PTTVMRTTGPAAWVLTSPGDALAARALVGGPRTATGSVRATVHVRTGGVALIAEQTGPGQAIVGEFAPGAPPRVVRLAGGAAVPLCTAPQVLEAFDPLIGKTLRLAIAGSTARLLVDDNREVVACDLGTTERGAWGVAALGTGAQIEVD